MKIFALVFLVDLLISCSLFAQTTDSSYQKQPDTLAIIKNNDGIIEAQFPGGDKKWKKFLSKNLNANVTDKNGAPPGKYDVVVAFEIGIDGTVSAVSPKTSFGYGMEKEVERVIMLSPKWTPSTQYGRKIKSFREQHIIFTVTKRKF